MSVPRPSLLAARPSPLAPHLHADGEHDEHRDGGLDRVHAAEDEEHDALIHEAAELHAEAAAEAEPVRWLWV